MLNRRKSHPLCRWRHRLILYGVYVYFFDEGYAIDLVQCGKSRKNLLEGRLTQPSQTFKLGSSPDLGTRSSLNNHLTDIVGKIEQFMNRGSSAITSMVTSVTPSTQVKDLTVMLFRFQT